MIDYISSFIQKSIGLIVIFLILPDTLSMGQQNGNFDNSTCSLSAYGTITDAFHSGCVPGWNASHGAPYLVSSTASVIPPYSSPYCAYMDYNAGIFTDYNFVQGVTYTITYRVNTEMHIGAGINQEPCSPASYSIYACNGLSNSNGSMPSISEKQTIHSYSYSEWDSWRYVVINNFVPTQNFSQLWITPNNMNQYLGLWIDDVVIYGSCPSGTDILYQNTTFNSSYSSTGKTITAGENVDPLSTTGPVTVASGANVTFNSYNNVTLMPGFLSDNGSVFLGDILPCTSIPTMPSTCYDGVLNGDETSIDCGGSCAACGGCATAKFANALWGSDQSTASSAYPNPTSGIFQVNAGGPIDEVRIYDNNGDAINNIIPAEIGNGLYQFDLTGYKTGIYLIKYKTLRGYESSKINLVQ